MFGLPSALPSRAIGVGKTRGSEDPVASVRGSHVGSSYATPRHVIPQRGQVPENGSPDGSVMERANRRHVLDRDVPRSKLANDPLELGPDSSLRMVEAIARAGVGSALAREPPDDPVDPLEVVGADGSDVIVNRAPWPASCEEGSPVGFTFDEPGVLDAGVVEALVEEAGA